MVGVHPELYGLPETHLLMESTVEAFSRHCGNASFAMADGTLRAIAECFYGEQTDETVGLAMGWLNRRGSWSTGMVFEALAEQVHPRRLVDKSSSMPRSLTFLNRASELFPRARYLHIVRHPCSYSESVMREVEREAKSGVVPLWLRRLASAPFDPVNVDPYQGRTYDPQSGWFYIHSQLREFLEPLPANRWLRIRGEELLADPAHVLCGIAEWLGIRSDHAAIQAMQHPEKSPYARLGPSLARHGNDLAFLMNPSFSPAPRTEVSLDGPLPWRPDGREFQSKVKELARHFGYV
jgi:hypothetical protein